nr:sugar transferase [Secundilactobacillus paracollinoides]
MGLWQARGRSQVGYPERAKIEMDYIDHASLKLDFQIVLKNIINIFSRKGAY